VVVATPVAAAVGTVVAEVATSKAATSRVVVWLHAPNVSSNERY